MKDSLDRYKLIPPPQPLIPSPQPPEEDDPSRDSSKKGDISPDPSENDICPALLAPESPVEMELDQKPPETEIKDSLISGPEIRNIFEHESSMEEKNESHGRISQMKKERLAL